MLLSPPTYFGLDAQLRQIPFKFYIIQVVLYYHGSFSTNVQTYKSFKFHFIQDSYSLWRQPIYKHSDLQIIQAFFYSSQLFSVASAFLQTFKSFKLSLIQRSYSLRLKLFYKNSNVQIKHHIIKAVTCY